MAHDHDYGPYGSGLDGYVHYRQAMQESERAKRPYNRPPQSARDDRYTPTRAQKNRTALCVGIVVFAVVVACILIGMFLC